MGERQKERKWNGQRDEEGTEEEEERKEMKTGGGMSQEMSTGKSGQSGGAE